MEFLSGMKKKSIGLPNGIAEKKVLQKQKKEKHQIVLNWGIGRELYTAPSIYIPFKDREGKENYEIKQKGNKKTTYTKFHIEKIQIIDKEITGLAIKNDKGKRVFVYKKEGK